MAENQGEDRELHVIVGSGAIGTAIAARLVAEGHRVRVITRSGSQPQGTEGIAVDASDADALARQTTGATVLYNCANPPYHQWPTLWPPMARALLGAAQRSGAVLVTVSNLYGYGPAPDSLGVPAYDEAHPMTESTPLAAPGIKGQVRAAMWRETLDAHEQGTVRVVEVRASDYVGPGAQSVVGTQIGQRVTKGRTATTVGRVDQLHTWTYTGDVAALAITVGRDARAWGRAWHVPSTEPRSQRAVADDLARVAGVRRARLRAMPAWALHALGFALPLIRELRETEYQFRDAFVMDSSDAQLTFGLDPTPWALILERTWRSLSGEGPLNASSDVSPTRRV